MTTQAYHPVWNLENIFAGGSASPAFTAFLDRLAADIEQLKAGLGVESATTAQLKGWSLAVQDIAARMHEAESFVGCLTAQSVKDLPAKQLEARLKQMDAAQSAAWILLERHSLAMADDAWAQLMADPDLAPIAYVLSRRRQLATAKLPPALETLAGALGVDGYAAWESLRRTVVGRMTIPVEQDGQTQQLSVGQAANRLRHPERAYRAELWAKWNTAWQEQEEIVASVLNSIGGFRLALYKARGWTDVLQEPLNMSRLSRATLDAMWSVIAANKAPLVEYIKRKGQLVGADRIYTHDLMAPLGSAKSTLSYDEGAAFILEQFHRFSPKMADFARRAFEQRWIEAEDRPGKSTGGFHTRLPVSAQSRIFMTYDGSPSTVDTLAHELGHAYHAQMLQSVPYLVRAYGMSLAETASTFAEMIVGDAALKRATDPTERLALLDNKIKRTVTMMMNIHARFLFESRFYAAREQGTLTAAQLCELATGAQREAYGGALDEYAPYIWASTDHFFFTDVPFYNFPYTFGYLFSAGIYAQAQAEGPAFEDKYIALLQDTGRLSVEEVAARHLGVDLTQPAFWERAVNLVLEDVHAFLAETAAR